VQAFQCFGKTPFAGLSGITPMRPSEDSPKLKDGPTPIFRSHDTTDISSADERGT
jgi:hypothetical protein